MRAQKGGEVFVQVVAAAINASDVKSVLGKMSQTIPPRVPGHDFAGRVVSGDSHLQGGSVFRTGSDLGFGRDRSHTEFMAVPIRFRRRGAEATLSHISYQVLTPMLLSAVV
jgi:NADPH2:quinone reductase